MRALMRLTKNGHSIGVTIPRAMLMHLGWLPGGEVVLEVLEDKTLWVRPHVEAAHRTPGIPGRVLTGLNSVQP